MRKNSWIIGMVAGIACLLSACGKKQAVATRPSFSSDSAYAYIERQMAFGPRVPNSNAHMQCAVWLIEQLKAFGAEVELQKGFMPDYKGDNQQIYNIIGHFTPSLEGRDGEGLSRPRILLGAHYDTRPWCDEEEDYSERFYNVPGANDGASGVGVLLEVARQLGLRVADSTLSTPVDIIFFDCEDMGTPRVYTGAEREDTWCLGSQLWATNYANNIKLSNSEASNGYQYGIILDMVGAPDAVFPLEMYSTQYASNYQHQIWRAAEQLGYGSMWVKQQSYPITDDHYYINYIAGIPCVDVIHYDIRNATGFPHWWHTRNDNMDNISKSTLQAVGEVVMSQL
ncbi:MAG: M28 family peptidase [Paludibacteraceae bacterium]|nr:M28 family peptidase [Paludibacteraceae bacterium]